MPDYIPSPDADFDNWLVPFIAYVTANAAAPDCKNSWTK
jgi:hypothetical protein